MAVMKKGMNLYDDYDQATMKEANGYDRKSKKHYDEYDMLTMRNC